MFDLDVQVMQTGGNSVKEPNWFTSSLCQTV
ncbi:FDLD family class I lanthipeptide [Tumebacillus permanentifrigoris]|nr:FDLD family class I lanthipeptide [Tumebacillus permanentifrigoris]